MSVPATRRLRLVAGVLAIAALLTLALFVPRWGTLRLKAVVDADRTFRLGSVAEGRHQWSLRAGWAAEGEALVREQVLQAARSDLVELEINPALQPGQRVEEGQVVAWLRSPADARSAAEVEALRAEISAQRALLGAGGRPAEVDEARRRVELAHAAWDGHQPELLRVRRLHAEGAASAAELEAAEVQDRLLALEREVAEATLRVVGSSARPEALQVLDAQIAALDARAAELAARLEGETIVSPISGLLEMGGRSVVLRIYDLDPVYLRLALPERERHRVQVGSQVLFTTQATSLADFTGRVVDISEDAATAPDGTQVFWVSAEVANPELLLRSGMSGVARLDMDGGAGQVLGFWRELLGTGP